MKLFNVVVVDDERPAVEELAELLSASPLVGEIRSFNHPTEAYAAIVESPPDVVFLDIQMPGKSGLQLAEELLLAVPDCEVVFVTAYEQYALRAFDLAALDYLLKPIHPERLGKTLDRIQQRKLAAASETEPAVRASIRCFGPMRLTGPAGRAKWKTAKVSEMFAYLYLHREASPDRLLEVLFPESGYEKARGYLHTCIYQLRKSLTNAGLSSHIRIEFDSKMYCMEVRGLECDLSRFEELTLEPGGSREALLETMALYEDELLKGMEGIWLLERREHCRRQFVRIAEQLLGEFLEEHLYERALEIAQKLQSHDPENEERAIETVRLYLVLGQKREAADFFQRFQQHYQHALGLELPAAILLRGRRLLSGGE